ncbi:chemotaxis protein [Streptomyces uncialis]|uniref:baeRF3 domain-containing protein n=1 Tax=Streptomyces uncialis TaxID=1048205 RepID=UPI003863F2DA|nr:chemotaxis protein [Streptomyces uncialis]
MHPRLDPRTLARLREPRPYPALSLLMPTHRREPHHAQDHVRLRNLVAEAKNRLRADPAATRARSADIADQLDQAVAATDLALAEDGLAVFAAPGEHQVWYLNRAVPERVVLSDTFLTRNLVAADLADRPYWVLAVSADHISLWDGRAERVSEVRTGPFPLVRSLADPDAERQERVGDLPSTFRDEATRAFLRRADEAMAAVLADHPRPLYAAGEAAALTTLAEVGGASDGGAGEMFRVPHGGLAQGPPELVWQAVLPFHSARQEAENGAVLRDLDRARGRREFAAGADEVWRNATEGRVDLLAVEENYRVTVRDDGHHLMPARHDDLDSREDLVDEIVERCLTTGATVRFLPDGTLADLGRIAGVLRY